MTETFWPWTAEEEALWEEQLRIQEFGWIDELIEHMVSQGLGASIYDPREEHDAIEEEDMLIL